MPRLPSHIEITRRVRVPASELQLSYARSGGPGGQHVNRTSTKVQLRWNVPTSVALSDEDRALLLQRLAHRLTKDGDLLIQSERYRDQGRNVEDALGRFVETVRKGLARPRPRKKTKPSRAARQRRLDDKRQRSDIKRQRRSPPDQPAG